MSVVEHTDEPEARVCVGGWERWKCVVDGWMYRWMDGDSTDMNG